MASQSRLFFHLSVLPVNCLDTLGDANRNQRLTPCTPQVKREETVDRRILRLGRPNDQLCKSIAAAESETGQKTT